MEFLKRIILLIVKITVVLAIPYYWLIDSTRTNTTSVFTGLWGISQGGLSYEGASPFIPIWADNQILFSLLFILPLIAFSLFYEQRTLDRKCIAAAGVSAFISCIVTFLSTPNMFLSLLFLGPTLVVPNVVSLSIFVFVFWPLLRNLWPTIHSTELVQKESRRLSKVRRVFSKYVPINIATLVWVSGIIFPGIVTIANYMVSETQLSYSLGISGGLPTISYYYTWFTSGGSYHPSYLSEFIFITASGISPIELLFWSLNLWLGVTTLQFILGKSTIKRVRILAIVAILMYAIPAIISFAILLAFGMGFLSIPLPFYPIIMLLVAKFVHAPTQKEPISGEMIHVPLKTRISSIFERGRSKKESPSDVEIVSEEDTEISDI
ncbi:MAG: hypothetical protein E4H14_05655 [Candidatus Thorarchaeota archaeon]|nr:MAG: hypothetical protein E4H14_05655 [Candidatus Thorarchaeota archaeon]